MGIQRMVILTKLVMMVLLTNRKKNNIVVLYIPLYGLYMDNMDNELLLIIWIVSGFEWWTLVLSLTLMMHHEIHIENMQ